LHQASAPARQAINARHFKHVGYASLINDYGSTLRCHVATFQTATIGQAANALIQRARGEGKGYLTRANSIALPSDTCSRPLSEAIVLAQRRASRLVKKKALATVVNDSPVALLASHTQRQPFPS
jgi:hypothetical protein